MTPEEIEVTPPPAPVAYSVDSAYLPTNPMTTSVKILGICFAVFAAFFLCIFLFIMVSMGASGVALAHQPAPAGSRASEQTAAQMVGMSLLFGGAFSASFAIVGLLALAAAIGLLTKKSWGRPVSIVAALPLLLGFPFGTALAVSTLVVMLGANAKLNYARLCG